MLNSFVPLVTTLFPTPRCAIKKTPQVLKVKVGGRAGPASDADRTLEFLQDSPRESTIRLDANQAWSMEEALEFFAALAEADGAIPRHDSTIAAIEYIEEPLKDPRALEELWERSGKVVPYALDESLAMGREAFTDDVRISSSRDQEVGC